MPVYIFISIRIRHVLMGRRIRFRNDFRSEGRSGSVYTDVVVRTIEAPIAYEEKSVRQYASPVFVPGSTEYA